MQTARNDHKRTGDCYASAGKALMGALFHGAHYEMTLVHGEVTGQGEIAGLRYGHAWLELGDVVLEVANGRRMIIPKHLYYQTGKIGGNVHRYSYAEMARKAVETGHWGPWDLQTESGL